MLKIKSEDLDHLTLLTLSGEFSGDASDKLRREAIESLDSETRDFVVDLSKVEYIDSRGLETLIWLEDRAAERLGQIRLASATGDVATILRMTRMDQRFTLHDTIELATQDLAA